MEVIARLEPWRRGLYTGAFGYVGRDGRLELAMAIRTLQLHGEEGAYFTGGGIVADSVPERELEETRWKAAQLARLA
jgi:anthranilate/para-aminobenzoate synthase component I